MRSWPDQVRTAVRRAVVEQVPREHTEPDDAFRRRRLIVGVTVLVGTALLGLSLATRPGDPAFYWLTLALALTWTIGGVLSGPLHLGRIRIGPDLRRPVVNPFVLGLAAAVVFVVGALIIREVDPLRRLIKDVLEHASEGSLALVLGVAVLNAVAEEVFFRGALFAAIGRRRPVTVSTVIYTLTTLATANPMLVVAAAALGTVLGLQRRASGGILAPMITHVTWSVVMVLALPVLFT
jgi:CAAX protease family protein